MVQLDRIMEMAYGNETTPKPRSITKAYNTPNIHVPK